MMHQGTPQIHRADLAAALVDLAGTDRNVATALAVCEAWETGYVGSLLTRAEHLCSADHGELGGATVRDRALHAIDLAVRQDNPFQRVHHAGVLPSEEAIQALLDMLAQQAHFHDVAGDLERRDHLRTPPPQPPEQSALLTPGLTDLGE